ncbi:MAG: hypothetical protein RL885_08930 [Planctomycetota bacterium]
MKELSKEMNVQARSGKALMYGILGTVIVVAVLGGVYLFAQKENAERQYKADLTAGQKALELADTADAEAAGMDKGDKERRRKIRVRDEYLDQAKNAFRICHDERPEAVEPLLGLGRVAYLLGRYNEAIDYFKQVKELGGDSADVHYELGRSYTKWFQEKSDQTLVDNAILHLEAAVQRDPDHVGAHMFLATIFGDQSIYHRNESLKLKKHEDAVLRLAPDSALAEIIREDRKAQ